MSGLPPKERPRGPRHVAEPEAGEGRPRFGGWATIAGRMRRQLVDGGRFDLSPRARPPGEPAPDDPFLGALVDAWATVLHVLDFYQDRIADEGYLGTATLDRSVAELVWTLDVSPRPALAATTVLAVTVDERGAAPEEVTVPGGTAIQSTPGGTGLPQVYETAEDLVAHRDLNALSLAPPDEGPARLTGRSVGVVVRTARGARPGDTLFLAGMAGGRPWWAVQAVRRVGRGRRSALALLLWDAPLDADLGDTPIDDLSVAVLGKPLPLFGYDARPWEKVKLADRVAATGPVGGLFRRTDAWAPLPAAMDIGEITALVHVGSLLFAGVKGRGVHRSRDGGVTWERANTGLRTETIYTLSVDAAGRVLAGTGRNGLVRSSDEGDSWVAVRGALVVRPQWPMPKRLRARIPGGAVRCAFAFSVDDTGYVVAGTDAGAWWFADGGEQWEAMSDGLPGYDATTGQAATAVRAVAVVPGTTSVLAATDRGLYRAASLGDPFAAVREGPVRALATTPSGTVLAAGDAGLQRSEDQGTTWSEVKDLAPRTVRVLEAAGDALWAGTDAGVWRSDDDGATWTAVDGGPQDVRALAASDAGVWAAAPLVGAIGDEWPAFDLDPDHLDLARHRAALAAPARGVLEQPEEGGTRRAAIAVGEVRAVDLDAFGQRARTDRLVLDRPVTGFSRRAARVRLGGAPLRLSTAQIAAPDLLDADLTALLDDPARRADLLGTSHLEPRALGGTIEVDGEPDGLSGRRISVEGRRPRVRVETAAEVSFDGADWQAVPAGTTFQVLGEPHGGELAVQTAGGARATLRAPATSLAWRAADARSPLVSTVREVRLAERGGGSTRLVLDQEVGLVLDPATVVVRGNTVTAVHGRTFEQTLGSGDATRARPSFTLLHDPLGWRLVDGAPVPEIEIRVDGARWRRVDRLSEAGPLDPVFVVTRDADGRARITFGDGRQGARLPSGRENVVARYRVGAGADGNTDAGRIHLLRNHPRWVRRAANVVPATGGLPAETAASVRERAPRSVRTLGRAVSISDLQTFVRDYPGVGQADAVTAWDGHAHVHVLTVAPTDPGADATALADAIGKALAALQRGLHLVRVLASDPVPYEIGVRLLVSPDRALEAVRDAVAATLGDRFGPARAVLGAPIAPLAVVAAAAAVPGVLDVQVTRLARKGSDAPVPRLLEARRAGWDPATRTMRPTEILVLDTVQVEGPA